MNYNYKLNYFSQNITCQKNIFKQSKFREITTNLIIVYINDVKITINVKKQYKKLFYLPKRNKRIYFTVTNFFKNSNNNILKKKEKGMKKQQE